MGDPVVVYLHWLPPKDDEVLRTLHHESGEFVAQNTLDLVRLLDFDTHSDRINGRLDEYTLVFIPGYHQ